MDPRIDCWDTLDKLTVISMDRPVVKSDRFHYCIIV